MIRLIVLALLVVPASAAIQVSQGDIVYMNETVDISQAASWPSYQIVWCSVSNFDCDPPDQIIDASNKSLEEFYVDPAVMRIGTYYRWDGMWHPAENAVAFTVRPGKRPKASAYVNTSEQPAAITKTQDGPFHYVIARGDTPEVYTFLQNQSVPCHLWIFSNTMNSYNLPMQSEANRYSYQFNKFETLAMSTGDYAGYIQCEGKNELQEIFINGVYLDTPYDDNKVPDVPLVTWNLLNTKRQFDELAKSMPRFDDELIPITISVVDPTTTITDVEQDEKKLYISGSTTWGNNTAITLRLDPDNYVLKRDIELHTWQAYATGSIDTPRTFATALSLDKEELFIGMHEITSTVESKGDIALSSFNFRVSDVMVMPTPTPEPKRMIYGKDWEEIPIKVVPTPTVEVTVEETPEPKVVMVTLTPTANVAANATATPTSIPTADKTIPTIPISAATIVSALAIAEIIRRRL